MIRQGTYTRTQTPFLRLKWAVRRRIRWFLELSWKKKLLLFGGPVISFLIIIPIITYFYFYNDIADQDRLMNRNNTGIVLKDINGETFYSIGKSKHQAIIPVNNISDYAEKALIAAEDKEFYEHSGFSLFGIIRSIYGNIIAQDITGGGSTLTQQLAKNTLLTNEQTILRKYQELTVAMAIEQRYSKDQILEMYLNSVYYGNNSFGIEDAAQNYFGKSANDLTLAESALLIGLLPSPSAYSPVGGNVEYAKERQNYVLDRMLSEKYITKEQKDEALSIELSYLPAKFIDNEAPHFTEMVLNELYQKYGEEKVKRSGYQVTTTLDNNLQKVANSAINANLSRIEANGGSNASAVAIDPLTGQVRALVGSIDYNNEQFGKVNMATSPRQPGSSFKPLYYAGALAEGEIATTTVFKDESTNFNGYQPKNATRKFYGNVTTRQALAWSLNIPAVKIMQQFGIDNAIDVAKRLGIKSLKSPDNYGLSLALGAAEVPLSEMTNAYATLANKGVHTDRSIILTINDKFDKQIYENSSPKQTSAISAQGAYLVSDILSDNAARSGMFGSSLNVLGSDYKIKKVAVKTGTTDESRDAWTLGYTPEIAVGVWVGNNDNTRMYSGGSDMAGPIWKNIMKAAIGNNSPSFERPSGIVEDTVCNELGKIKDIFLSTYIPSKGCVEEKPKDPEPVEETPVITEPENNNDDQPSTDNPDDDSTNTDPNDNSPNPPNNSNGNNSPNNPTNPTNPNQTVTPTSP